MRKYRGLQEFVSHLKNVRLRPFLHSSMRILMRRVEQFKHLREVSSALVAEHGSSSPDLSAGAVKGCIPFLGTSPPLLSSPSERPLTFLHPRRHLPPRPRPERRAPDLPRPLLALSRRLRHPRRLPPLPHLPFRLLLPPSSAPFTRPRTPRQHPQIPRPRFDRKPCLGVSGPRAGRVSVRACAECLFEGVED